MSWTKRRDVMLCQPLDDKNLERLFKASGFVFVQPKLDGERAWVACDAKPYTIPDLISSTGNDIVSVPHINFAVRALLNLVGAPTPFDGELYIKGASFETISSIVSRTVNIHPDYTDMRYHIFDLKLDNEPQYARMLTLTDMAKKWTLKGPEEYKDIIQFVPTNICESPEEVHEYYAKYINEGYEGIIVRHPDAFYVTRDPAARPWFILKFKPKRQDKYIFVRYEEAVSQDGISLGRVGAIVCKDEEGNEFKVGPGTGYTHVDLEKMWTKNIPEGSLVVVEYQNLTKTNGVPRFGKFVSILRKGGINESTE